MSEDLNLSHLQRVGDIGVWPQYVGVDFDVWALQELTVFPSQAEQLHEDVLLFY